ncbi:hypothetical protein X740_13600 [Mesorhizobium sp. LNHC221B00]|nr:hypothetical protein X740_13600 [Mesorhizobium sp. LNHC221B00]
MLDPASLESLVAMWLAILVTGLLAVPITGRLFPGETATHYFTGKILGWLICTYMAWLLSAFKLISFERSGVVVGLASLAAISALCSLGSKTMPRRDILRWEMVFFLVYFAGVTLRAENPDIRNLEKFMDFGFVNAALRADYMPPPDPWWAGEPINYYYFGHVAAAWLTKLSGVPSDHGYNLMIGVLFAFTAIMAFCIVRDGLRPAKPAISMALAVSAAALVTLGGNFHSVLYGPLRGLSPTTLGREFRFPDSTRYVGFDPPTTDKVFTEMPAYGFTVGDLHAHLLNLPAGLLILLILFRLVGRRLADRSSAGASPAEILALGFLFAVSAMTNSWDAVSYGMLMGLAGLFIWLQPSQVDAKSLTWLVLRGVAVIAIACLLASPFLAAFKPFASNLRLAKAHTPIWQLAIVYGHVAVPCLVLLTGLFLWARDDAAWKSAAMLAALALLLVALPELVYVEDIYGGEYVRANTMFKFSFAAQPVAMLASVLLIGLLLSRGGLKTGASAAVLAIPLFATLSYFWATHAGIGKALASNALTLDGLGSIDRDRAADRPLLDWLRAQGAGQRILLVEASGDSYTDAGRLSAMSGVPTVMGWQNHEWLWRGDYGATVIRAEDVASFYSSKTPANACRILTKYGITHIAIGTVEREKYAALDGRLFRGLGTVIVNSGPSILVRFDASTCPNGKSTDRMD